MKTVALAYSITEEAIEDNLYGSVAKKYSKALVRSLKHTKEIEGAAIFNNGFSSSYPGGDGKPLFATDHPLYGGGTFSNTLPTAADFSEAALEDAMVAIGNFVDERGIPMNVQARKLILPNATIMFDAFRVLKSDLRSGTNDNDPNALRQMGYLPDGMAILHRLTDDDSWFIITDCQDGLKHFVRKPVQTATEGEFNTGNIRYKAWERYAFGWTDPRGAFGVQGQ